MLRGARQDRSAGRFRAGCRCRRNFFVRTRRATINIAPMSDAYRQLLDATIAHLENLRARGRRFVALAPETWQALRETPQAARRVPVSVPASVPSPSPSFAGSAPVTVASAPLSVAAAPALDREAKEAAMAELRARAMSCTNCPHLAAARRHVVFGVGDIHSPLMFIGEAPGMEEDEQGEPFVGKAGQLLTKIIETMGLSRNSVYIANILKCRPDTPGQATGNRKPTLEEMNTCKPYVLEQIDIIRPRVIVALGGTAVEGLLGIATGITKLRGHWQSFRGIPVMPTYHPAYLLRNQAMSEKRRVWEDMLQVMERLGMPISDKQRGFFLKRA
jgi:DNA polymerase